LPAQHCRLQTIKTFIVIGGALAIEIWFPHMFYRLVALIAYILSIIFWLSAWAWAASTAALWLSTSCYFGTCSSPSSYASREGGALAGCAGLGAIVW
jgi:membrane protein implicated in regulation of membrane protease activity